jgi:hypothetical protein
MSRIRIHQITEPVSTDSFVETCSRGKVSFVEACLKVGQDPNIASSDGFVVHRGQTRSRCDRGDAAQSQSLEMGIIREPEGIDFIISGGPLPPEGAAEISEFLRQGREARAKARAAREKLEAKALALPNEERTQLAYQLLSSLAADETDESQREWASAAKAEFEQLHASRPPTKTNKKPARRTKPART